MQDVAIIRAKVEALRPYLDERRRRLWAAAEAMALGRGGLTAVATATGLQHATIRVGMRELSGVRQRAPKGRRWPMGSIGCVHAAADTRR